MRDAKRIDVVLNKFKELWNLNPDLRFWQVIGLLDFSDYLTNNKNTIDPFFLEDEDWVKILDKTILKYKKGDVK